MKTIHSSNRLAGTDFNNTSSGRGVRSVGCRVLDGLGRGGALWWSFAAILVVLALALEAGARPFRGRGQLSTHVHGGYAYRGSGGLGLSGGYPIYRAYGGYGYRPYGTYYSYGYETRASYYPSYVPRTYFWSRGGSGTGIRIYSSGQSPTSPSTLRPSVFVMEPLKSVEDQRAEAWSEIARGNDEAASLTFEAMEQQLPGAAWPKIGTGLLAGFSGDFWAAKYRFRRAFRFDAGGPGELPMEPGFSRRLTELANHYRGRMASGDTDKDAEFMVAALTYLARDYSSAQVAIESAMVHGDVSRSAVNLKRLIDRAVIVAGESRTNAEVALVDP